MPHIKDSPLTGIPVNRFRRSGTRVSVLPVLLSTLLAVVSANTLAEEKKAVTVEGSNSTGSVPEQDARSIDAQSLGSLRQQMEEAAIQLYENRTRDLERFKKLEESVEQVNAYLRRSNQSPAVRQHATAGTPETNIQPGSESAIPVEKSGYDTAAGSDMYPAAHSGAPGSAATAFDTSSYAAPLEAMLAAVLVFLAPLGFSFLEASRTEQSRVPPILLRNLMVTAIMLLTFATVGSWISYGQSLLVSISPYGSQLAPNGSSNDTFWLFHLEMTIMVGLVANTILSSRISLWGHALMALLLGALVHPLMGRWIWMGHWIPADPGWLQKLGFLDFAGATVIHSMGAWFSLAWLWRFPLGGGQHPESETTGGNPVYALLALFILWLNWFGLAMGYHHLDTQLLALPIINVSLAGATAIVVSFLMSVNRGQTREADCSLIYFRLATGVLGGLVAVSAGVDRFTPVEAMAVGGLASLIQAYTYRLLQATLLRQDHTSAALIATHGFSGVFGTLCLGFMGAAGSFTLPEIQQLGIQALGIAVALGFGSVSGLISAVPYQLISKSRSGSTPPPPQADDETGTTPGQTLAQEIGQTTQPTTDVPADERQDGAPAQTP